MRIRFILLAVIFACPAAWPIDLERQLTFEISPQKLSTALLQFSHQTGVQVVVGPEVGEVKTAGINGKASIAEALKQLLEPSGLTYSVVGERSITVGKPQADSSVPVREVDEVIVTGTHIQGRSETSSPLQVINREEIDRAGVNSVPDLISTLTSGSGGGITPGALLTGVTAQNAYNNRGYAAGPNLRGLGSNATLTLLNGHRMPLASNGFSVDLGTIPLAAIDHIDVLKDGASSIYGSDAVAGVVNIVTRSDFEGAETRLTGSGVTSGSKNDVQASQLVGTSWSSGNGMLSYTFDRQESLSVKDRSFSRESAAGNNLIPPSRSHSVYGSITQSLASRLSLRADALFSDRKTDVRRAFVRNGQVNDQTGESSNDSFLASAGLRYALAGDWQLTGDALYSRNGTDYQTEDVINGITVANYKGSNTGLDLSASGGVFQMPGGSAKLAVGGSWRDENFESSGVDTFDLSRDIRAVYAELSLPFFGADNEIVAVRKLQLDASVRYEKYSDFGSTTNPRFGVLWHPASGWAVRSTYSKSFRAPLLTELGQANFNLLLELPDPLSASGTSLSLLRAGGNRELGSQTARNWTSGLTWTREDRKVSLGLDYFAIRFTDLIELPNGGAPSQMQPEIYGDFLHRDPAVAVTAPIIAAPNFVNLYGPFTATDIQLIVDGRIQNLASLETSGFDANVDLRSPQAFGVVLAAADVTYILRYRQALVPGQSAVDLLDTTYNPVSFKARVRLGVESGSWLANAYLNYVDGYTNNAVIGVDANVASWTTADVQLAYRPQHRSGLLADTEVALTVRNVFDEAPPFVLNPSSPTVTSSQVNYDPVNASPLGRYVSLRLSKSW